MPFLGASGCGKSITVLLAQMFIDDGIANREPGLLAGSVPELMLSYLRRLDTPADAALRRRAGLVISEAMVQRALRVVALPRQERHLNPTPGMHKPDNLLERFAQPAGLAIRSQPHHFYGINMDDERGLTTAVAVV